jgi:hypothetical protein
LDEHQNLSQVFGVREEPCVAENRNPVAEFQVVRFNGGQKRLHTTETRDHSLHLVTWVTIAITKQASCISSGRKQVFVDALEKIHHSPTRRSNTPIRVGTNPFEGQHAGTGRRLYLNSGLMLHARQTAEDFPQTKYTTTDRLPHKRIELNGAQYITRAGVSMNSNPKIFDRP